MHPEDAVLLHAREFDKNFLVPSRDPNRLTAVRVA